MGKKLLSQLDAYLKFILFYYVFTRHRHKYNISGINRLMYFRGENVFFAQGSGNTTRYLYILQTILNYI